MDHREKWNRKHKERLDELREPVPNERLKNLSPYMQGGTALDIACGLGGNSLFLAQLGYEVMAVDISEVAADYVQEMAVKQGLMVTTMIGDLTKITSLPLKKHSFDFVMNTYYLERSIIPYVKELVKQNGFFFMETYYKSPNAEHQRVSSQYKLESNELLAEFLDWKILFFEENGQEGRQTIFCQKQGI